MNFKLTPKKVVFSALLALILFFFISLQGNYCTLERQFCTAEDQYDTPVPVSGVCTEACSDAEFEELTQEALQKQITKYLATAVVFASLYSLFSFLQKKPT